MKWRKTSFDRGKITNSARSDITKINIANTTNIATKEAGTARVSLGNSHIISMVKITSPEIINKLAPVSQAPEASLN